ncbi:hypothetical protein P5G86_09535 [Paenibacillus jamilae]|uniref:Uncharacterized protein n=1 Tax=Bacillus thuringiensis serovar subtoxicus TaxID=475791 RepID=A0A9X6IJ27_BACTU|nr:MULTISPECIES: hypothetical protein [Bacillaceae]MEB4840316.1 hypothetical protein [Paenibacillus jamilae]MEB8580888.1 hypothetical protein [Bacillus cereus]MCR6851507.1 hypothetical protein [Bacillus thuringiensis]MDR4283020.1 hypothetical protein [Bacillus thuringiensis]MEB8593231.1 hypothetical protein [Bacillus cereus]
MYNHGEVIDFRIMIVGKINIKVGSVVNDRGEFGTIETIERIEHRTANAHVIEGKMKVFKGAWF